MEQTRKETKASVVRGASTLNSNSAFSDVGDDEQ